MSVLHQQVHGKLIFASFHICKMFAFSQMLFMIMKPETEAFKLFHYLFLLSFILYIY